MALLNVLMRYIIFDVAQNLTTTWAALLVAPIKCSSVLVLEHARHDVKWALRAGSGTELWNMFAIIVK